MLLMTLAEHALEDTIFSGLRVLRPFASYSVIAWWRQSRPVIIVHLLEGRRALPWTAEDDLPTSNTNPRTRSKLPAELKPPSPPEMAL